MASAASSGEEKGAALAELDGVLVGRGLTENAVRGLGVMLARLVGITTGGKRDGRLKQLYFSGNGRVGDRLAQWSAWAADVPIASMADFVYPLPSERCYVCRIATLDWRAREPGGPGADASWAMRSLRHESYVVCCARLRRCSRRVREQAVDFHFDGGALTSDEDDTMRAGVHAFLVRGAADLAILGDRPLPVHLWVKAAPVPIGMARLDAWDADYYLDRQLRDGWRVTARASPGHGMVSALRRWEEFMRAPIEIRRSQAADILRRYLVRGDGINIAHFT
jgi:hypothetical protein